MKKLYADVIVDISHERLDRPFVYRVPELLREEIREGSAVKVPFGRSGRVIGGYVVAFHDRCELEDEKVRDIAEVSAGAETAEARMVALAAWMSRQYGSTMIQAMKTVIPVRKTYQAEVRKTVVPAEREKTDEYLALCEKKNWKARKRVITVLADHQEMSLQTLMSEANVTLPVIRELEKAGILRITAFSDFRHLIADADNETCPPDVLTKEQEEAKNQILREWEGDDRPVLLHGVTGSGKTSVYLELVAQTLACGRQAIVLIPEIALTRQTVIRFVRRFGGRVSFMHSRLSGGERYDQMKAAKAGQISVMVGPRSALFVPFSNLGLIIIDEEHEETYHSEMVPRYHARETAIKRAELEGAHVVLGSATPSLITADRAESGAYRKVMLTSRYGESELPETEIVDMREELQSGNRSMISGLLRMRMEEALAEHRQVMLFLNRRGYVGCITCRSCGHVIRCPHCDVSLTRHRNGKLICHYCGYETDDVNKCPSCGSPYIGGISVGTEQIEELLRKEFPQAGVLRMDADTTKGREGHGAILGQFSEGEADILVGTQMIVKGHDFPNVTLVGVLLADLSLSDDDYRSSERTYELIAQAVGRAGRGKYRGRAVVQTYQPEHYAIVAGCRQNYEEFYREEMIYRSVMEYPPCGCMAAILGSAKDEGLLAVAMHYIRKYIERIDPGNRMRTIGPAPQAVGKIRDYYRQVIYIRNRERELLVAAKDRIMEYIALNPGFKDVRVQFDFNV